MQQTTSREFSIIESSDPFLPEALNDNTRKIEAALDAHETQTKAVTDALAARVTALEGHKIAWGLYKGDGAATRVIPLPFTPTAAFVYIANTRLVHMIVEGYPYNNPVTLMENGLCLTKGTDESYHVNIVGFTYLYLAFC